MAQDPFGQRFEKILFFLRLPQGCRKPAVVLDRQ
jgi:hypothetical protein